MATAITAEVAALNQALHRALAETDAIGCVSFFLSTETSEQKMLQGGIRLKNVLDTTAEQLAIGLGSQLVNQEFDCPKIPASCNVRDCG